MNSYQQGRRQRHGRGRPRRRGGRGRFQDQRAPAPKQKTFWQRIVAFLGGDGGGKRKPAPQSRNGEQQQQQPQREREPRPQRKPESIEVTSPRLYVGNLSFDATESDLFNLFNVVGHVQNDEVVSYRHTQRAKCLAFVQLKT